MEILLPNTLVHRVTRRGDLDLQPKSVMRVAGSDLLEAPRRLWARLCLRSLPLGRSALPTAAFTAPGRALGSAGANGRGAGDAASTSWGS